MKRQLILASASPRRKELLGLLELPFTVCPASREEPVDLRLPLGQAIEQVAEAKAAEVFRANPEALVLGSDTIVALKGQVLGKPKSREDAERMLRLLSGQSHQVITGLAVLSKEGRYLTHSAAEVRFAELSEEEIAEYVASGEPFGKAGAYAIQGRAARYITGITGDIYTVIGLPVRLVYAYLKGKVLTDEESADPAHPGTGDGRLRG